MFGKDNKENEQIDLRLSQIDIRLEKLDKVLNGVLDHIEKEEKKKIKEGIKVRVEYQSAIIKPTIEELKEEDLVLEGFIMEKTTSHFKIKIMNSTDYIIIPTSCVKSVLEL